MCTRTMQSVLNSCCSLRDLKRIHGRLLALGLSRRLALSTKLISLSAALSPTMDYARKLFDEIPLKDSFAWNTLIRGYADLGPCHEVPVLYKRMHHAGLSPDHFTFPFVVRSCGVLSAVREGKEAHCNTVKCGLSSNVYVQTALVAMYSQSGEISDSELVFDEMGFRNIVAWTAMIAGFAQNCLFDKAGGVFRQMVDSGTQPNEVSVASILPACNLESGRSIHGFVIKLGFDLYVTLANALIMMYAKCCCMNVARSLFDEMPERRVASWNTMIAAYELSGSGGEAIELFRRMVMDEVMFDSVTLVSVVAACTKSTDLDAGSWVHQLARREGLTTDIRVGNALLDMYAKCGRINCAIEIFDTLPWKGIVSWSAMIGAYAAHGHASQALELFSRMKAEAVRPNSFTFTSVLAACSHSGLVEEGMQHFNSMRRDYGITPKVEHCACIVDLLSRVGRLDEAYDFVKRMPVIPDTGVWGALLAGCRIHGNLVLAELVVKELFKIEPHNVTYYVLMSNMYADAGRWQDAARVRSIIKHRQLKKAPGCSSVETENEVP